MIIQGSNKPITLTFEEDISAIPIIVATLWAGYGNMIKRWDKTDMTIEEDTAELPLTEAETAEMNGGSIALDVKGLDDIGNIIFWEEVPIMVLPRRDRSITMGE